MVEGLLGSGLRVEGFRYCPNGSNLPRRYYYYFFFFFFFFSLSLSTLRSGSRDLENWGLCKVTMLEPYLLSSLSIPQTLDPTNCTYSKLTFG